MSNKRNLDFVLSSLLRSLYLQKCTKSASFSLAPNGAKLRQNLVMSLRNGITGFVQVSHEEQAMEALKKGQSAIRDPNESIAAHEVLENNSVSTCEERSITVWQVLPKREHNSHSMTFQKLLRSRRQFWKGLLFDPGQVSVQEEGSIALIRAKLEHFKEDIPAFQLESIQMLDKTYNDNHKIVVSKCDPDVGTVAMLLDSLRVRQFLKTSRLALPVHLAPVQIGIVIPKSSMSDPDVKDLARYVQLLLIAEELTVVIDTNLQTLDDLGVPYTIIVNEAALANGVLIIRDRETSWYEQIHLAHVVPRMVKTFQDRKVQDTLTLVKQKYDSPQ